MDSFLKGFSYVFAGFGRLTHPRLRLFVIAPLLINVILFAGAIAWTAYAFDGWLNALTGWLPGWLDWVQWLLWPLFGIAAVLIMFYTFTMIANIVGAPLNGLLAEKVEQLFSDDAIVGTGVSFWAEIPRAIVHEISKWLYILPRALPLLLLFFIPGLNMLAPFAWFAFGAWMLVMEYADYPMGNHGIAFSTQRDLLRQRRLMALGFGAGVLGMTLVPVLNFLSMPTAVIGATLMWKDHFKPLTQDPAGGARAKL